MLSKKILGSGKGEKKHIRLGHGVPAFRERAGGPVFGCTLCPGSVFLVCSGLRAECVVIWGAFMESQCLGRGHWSYRQQTQGLCLREVLLLCA